VALLPGVVVHNWRLKISALGLSVFLWALVQTEPRNAETFTVPVTVEVSDTAWATSGFPEPSTVELRLSGPAREIIRLARQGTRIRVPIHSVGSSDTTVTLRRDWVGLGDGTRLTVESLSPSTVQIGFEPAESRAVPLAIRTTGELPANLALATPIGVNTQVVRLRGPASRLAGLDSVRLLPLDLSKVAASGVFEVSVDTGGLGGVRITPLSATLGLRVEDVVERVVTGVPVIAQSDGSDGAIVARPVSVDVTLRGARTLVAAVDPMDLRAWVAPELLRGMVAGEERRVPVRVEGVPQLVAYRLAEDLVTVRRTAGAPGRPGDVR
jgi:YbbR domain-containing protein